MCIACKVNDISTFICKLNSKSDIKAIKHVRMIEEVARMFVPYEIGDVNWDKEIKSIQNEEWIIAVISSENAYEKCKLVLGK